MKITMEFDGMSLIVFPDLFQVVLICNHTGQIGIYTVRQLIHILEHEKETRAKRAS